nr:MAG TPA: capsid scaffolding protein [Bacteriophage sp.]
MRTIRTLELARVGSWGKNSDPITEQDLRDAVETFTPRRPVGIGHDAMRKDDAPKYGNVWAVRLRDGGKTLTGEVEFGEELDELYTSGKYDGWSVSLPKRAKDGKAYLHHLAFLGATPPKIPGLKDLGEKPFAFADDDEFFACEFAGKLTELNEEVKMTKEEIEAMQKENAALKAANEKLTADNTELGAELKKAKDAKASGGSASAEAKSDANAVQNGTANGKAEAHIPQEFADRMKRYDEEIVKSRLAAFKAKVEGKVPAGVMEQAECLAGALARRDSSVNFSDNGADRTGSEIELLGSILSKWPEAVKTGYAGNDYADSGDSGKGVDWNGVASKM